MTREEALQAYHDIRKEKIRARTKYDAGYIEEWEWSLLKNFHNALMNRFKRIAQTEEEKRKEKILGNELQL